MQKIGVKYKNVKCSKQKKTEKQKKKSVKKQ